MWFGTKKRNGFDAYICETTRISHTRYILATKECPLLYARFDVWPTDHHAAWLPVIISLGLGHDRMWGMKIQQNLWKNSEIFHKNRRHSKITQMIVFLLYTCIKFQNPSILFTAVQLTIVIRGVGTAMVPAWSVPTNPGALHSVSTTLATNARKTFTNLSYAWNGGV